MKKIFFTIALLPCFLILTPKNVYADQTNNLSVSATIGPQASDYQFSLIASDGLTTVWQYSTMSYQITYGAKQSSAFATDTVITVDYSSDLAPNNAHLLDYITGTASTGYGGAKPVVDLTNRTITWTITNLPAGTTDQTLNFQLKALDVYPKSIDNPIPFTITAKMTNQYVTMNQPLTQYYRYHIPPPGPTATPAPQPAVAVTPTPPPPPAYIVAIPGITDNNASVSISTAYPSKLSVSYGTSPSKLSRTISTNDYSYQHSLTLPDLLPDTTYYFRFTLTYQNGDTITSELFTLHTAKKSLPPNVASNIVVFFANGNIYFSDTQQNAASHPVILTNNSDYEISYAFTKPINVKRIEAIVQKKILAANTFSAAQLQGDLIIPMQKRVQNLYVATAKAMTLGLFEIFLRIHDANGNIIQRKIADLKVMPRFTVYALDTERPLQDARVYLSYFDTQTKRYLPLSQQLFGNISNPSYTDSAGQLPITLPEGKYRVEESALLYNKVITDFIIGPGLNQNYPVVYLRRDPLDLSYLTSFTADYFSDTWNKATATLQGYSSSIRLFHLFAVAILLSFILVNFLLFTMRSQIKAHHLPIFLLFHVDRMLNRHQQKYIYGTITDEENRPVSQALIEVEDRDTKKIILEMTTNKFGRFYFRNTFAGEINLLLSKEGYEVTTIPVNTLSLPERGLQLALNKGTEHYHSTKAHLIEGIRESVGILFETSLVMTLILELLFFSIYGFVKTTPYLVMSIINILLWLFYVHEHSQKSQL